MEVLQGVWELVSAPDRALDALLGGVAPGGALSATTLRFFLAGFLSYPVAFLHRFLVSPRNRHLYSLVTGPLLLYVAFGPLGVVHQFVVALGVYVMLCTLPPALASRLSFYFSMAYLSAMHIHRLLYHYLEPGADWTAGQMMLTIKLASLAYSYNDGFQRPEQLLPEWTPLVVRRLPTPLEFFSFSFYFGSVIAGPPVWYNDYIAFIDLSAFPNRRIPNSLSQALWRLLLLVSSLAVFFLLSENFPISYALTPDYAEKPVYYWVLYMFFAGGAMRFQYYTIFALVETTADICGLSYNGLDRDGRSKWNRVNMMNIRGIELATSPRELTMNWNILASAFFKNYIYFRIAPPGTKPGNFANVATLIFSAFWHGFYPGYYLFFGWAAIMNIVARRVRSSVRPWIVASGSHTLQRAYDMLTCFLTLAAFTSGGPFWTQLSLDASLTYLFNVKFFFLLAAAFLYVFTLFVPRAPSTHTEQALKQEKKTE